MRRTASGWHAWLCGHHLEVPGHEDRMCTIYATSRDGLRWSHHGIVLRGRSGAWDARGARVTSVLPGGWFAYDARATAEENWWERTGSPASATGAGWTRSTATPSAAVRYLDVLALPGGGHRLLLRGPERRRGSHELRTERVAVRPRAVWTWNSDVVPGPAARQAGRDPDPLPRLHSRARRRGARRRR